MKRIVSVAIVLTLVLSSFSLVFADPWKDESGNRGFMPPGLAKKGGLPPGLAKKIIEDTDKEWPESLIKRIEAIEAILQELENEEQIQEKYKEYGGEITDIDNNYNWIKIKLMDKNYEKRFYLSNDVEIVFKESERGHLEDLELGDEAEIWVNDQGRIIYIKADRKLEDRYYEGRIIDVDNDGFSIYTSDKIIDFNIDDDFDINFKDRKGTIDNLRIGDEVEIIVEDDEVIKISVDRNRDIDSNIIYGKLADIYGNANQIVVKNNTEYKIYTLDEDVKIYLNTNRVSLSKLEKDDNLQLKMYRDKIIELKAYRY